MVPEFWLKMKIKEKSFNEKCYTLLREAPRGKITTYKSIAEALGTKAYRAVGNAMKKNPYAPAVPCHRVVNSNGFIGGFAHGTLKKIRLLRSEGVDVKNKKINLDKHFYGFKR